MKRFFLLQIGFLFLISGSATSTDSSIIYHLPDTVKAIQFLADMNVKTLNDKKTVSAGIKTDAVNLSMSADKKKRVIVFQFPAEARVVATGVHINTNEIGSLTWEYEWNDNENYKLLIAVASDSAENFSLYSGYVFLPKENKWKLIGTCKISGRWGTIINPATYYSEGKKGSIQLNVREVWCLRKNNSWFNLTAEDRPIPALNLFPHLDSMQQRQLENKLIEDALTAGTIDTRENKDGVFYKIIKEGTGRQVTGNDMVTVYYKLHLLNDDKVVDQTKGNPVIFPLKGLIVGWQIGVPLCKVGGKIMLVILSDQGYSIRTRSAQIPPNSTLVFEIEVVDAKPSL